MIKKISVSELKPGMYVHELGVSWLNHPFLRHRFLVKTEEDVARIVSAGIQSLDIDTNRGLDVPNAPTREEVRTETHHEMVRSVKQSEPIRQKITVAGEMTRARAALKHTQGIVRGVLNDVRLGHAPQIFNIETVVDEIAESVTRNSSALLSLLRLRNKDDYTFHHSVAVGVMLVTFAEALDQDADVVREIGIGGLLHDLGKMKIPDAILRKQGRLTEAEFEIMKSHTEWGHQTLTNTPGIGSIPLDIARYHHERVDGTGYPVHFSADRIPRHVRMASIVDVYDAITSERCYHAAVGPAEALRQMFECRNSQFDNELLSVFIRTIGIYPVGTLVRLESERLAVVISQNSSDALRPTVRAFFNTRTDCPIPVIDIDLAAPVGSGGADRIISDESTKKWQVDPMRVLLTS